MPGKKKKIEEAAEKTEEEAKEAGGKTKRAGKRIVQKGRKIGHKTKEKLRRLFVYSGHLIAIYRARGKQVQSCMY